MLAFTPDAHYDAEHEGNGYTRSPQMFEAHYSDVAIPAQQGNPLIETLPPMLSRNEVGEQLRHLPPYNDAHRWLPAQERLHLLTTAMDFFQPLPQHLDLVETMSTMICHGYVRRNPALPTYLPTMRRHLPSVLGYRAQSASEPIATSGFTLIGESGIGKSRGVSRALCLYPQVILHSAYKGQRFSHLQIVYLKISCPQDGSRKALCKEFFRAVDQCLGTSYYEHYVRSRESIDDLLISMGNLCLLHHVGVLVIDEIQNLREARAEDAAKMLNFFTQLDNEVRVPVVLIGTPRARPILTGGFRRARRAEGQGGVTWERLRPGSTWDVFVKTLWGFQYTHHSCPLTSELSKALWDESQGVADIAIKLYKLTQEWAISREEERITPDGIRETAKARLQFVQPFMTALREGNYRRLATDPMFDDLFTPSPAAPPKKGAPPQGSHKSSGAAHDSDSEIPLLPPGDTSAAAGTDTASAPQATISVANTAQTGKGKSAKKHASVSKTTTAADEPGGLLHVFTTRPAEMSPYEAFLEAGHIRSLAEYLPDAPKALHEGDRVTCSETTSETQNEKPHEA